MNPTITVVVPVYNVEKYLEQCIESLLTQTFSDFEIILVDDGSTDNSLAIEKRYANQDSRVKIIEKTHSNAGEARNIGLEQARGKYITFLDSDDFYDCKLLEKEYEQIEKHNADICACNGDHYNEKTKEYEPVNFFIIEEYLPQNLPFKSNECSDYIFQVIATGPWLRMYRLDFIREHNLKYQSIVRGNDVLFSNMTHVLAKRITIVNEVLVHHRIGLTHNLQSGLVDTPDIYLDIELNWKRELEKRDLFERYRKSFELYVISNLRAHFASQNTSIAKKLKERLQNGMLKKLGFDENYIKEKIKEFLSNSEQYSIWDEVEWLDLADIWLSLDLPAKDNELINLIKSMKKNVKAI